MRIDGVNFYDCFGGALKDIFDLAADRVGGLFFGSKCADRAAHASEHNGNDRSAREPNSREALKI